MNQSKYKHIFLLPHHLFAADNIRGSSSDRRHPHTGSHRLLRRRRQLLVLVGRYRLFQRNGCHSCNHAAIGVGLNTGGACHIQYVCCALCRPAATFVAPGRLFSLKRWRTILAFHPCGQAPHVPSPPCVLHLFFLGGRGLLNSRHCLLRAGICDKLRRDKRGPGSRD